MRNQNTTEKLLDNFFRDHGTRINQLLIMAGQRGVFARKNMLQNKPLLSIAADHFLGSREASLANELSRLKLKLIGIENQFSLPAFSNRSTSKAPEHNDIDFCVQLKKMLPPDLPKTDPFPIYDDDADDEIFDLDVPEALPDLPDLESPECLDDLEALFSRIEREADEKISPKKRPPNRRPKNQK